MKVIHMIMFALMSFPVMAEAYSGDYEVNILTPQKGAEVTGHVSVTADIKKGGKPFLGFPGLRWVSAVIEDSKGVDSVRVALRDNGHGLDSKPNDGTWTSLARIELLEGEYTIFVVSSENGQNFSSSKIKFNVETNPTANATVTTKNNIAEMFDTGNPLKVDANYKDLNLDLIRIKGLLKWLIAICIMIFLAFGAISLGIIKRFASAGKPKYTEDDTKLNSATEEVIITERWRPIFSTMENINKEILQMQKDISGTFRVHNRYKEKFEQIISNIISIYENIKDLKDIPKEHFSAFKLSLYETFETVGVEKWEPEVGKPVPEGCSQELATQDYPLPEGTVVEVLSPGYRIRENEEVLVIEKPKVRVKVINKL